MSTDYKCVTEIGAVREYLAGHDLVSFDYETAPDAAYRMEEKAALDPAKAHICTMSLSVKEHTGIMIPVAHLIGRIKLIKVPALCHSRERRQRFLAEIQGQRLKS